MELLIKNSRVVDFSRDFTGDVYIRDGLICEIGNNLNKNCKVIDGEGLVLLPSFIDLHAHFRDPGLTHKEDILSGSMAAVRGGYTGVNLMANTKPVCSSLEVVEYVLKKGKDIGLCDIHQTVSITRNMDGIDTSHLDDIDGRIRFISDDGKGVKSSRVMLEAMKIAREKGITVISHAEDDDIVSTDTRLSENLMSWRDICLCQVTGCHLHLAHVSTKEAIEYVIEAKKKGVNVTCEITPHHIGLVDSDYRVNPPIRNSEDVEAIIKAIKDGYVDSIATDHAPHTSEDKLKGSPGISGIETSFSLCYTSLVKKGHIGLSTLSRLMSRNPARMMMLNKGEISIGFDGDLVLVDIDKNFKVDSSSFASRGKNTPLNGTELYGEIAATIKGGKIVYKKEGLKW